MKISLLILITIFSSLTLADEESAKKYKDYTPEQINALPDSIKFSSVPLLYSVAAQLGVSPTSKLIFGTQLNTLMYSGLHDYENAIKAFQKDLGDKPTGILTVSQIKKLDQRSEMQKLPTILFPNDYYSRNSYDLGWSSLAGTMQILDEHERVASPINHVSIKCYKSENSCELRQIALIAPDEKSLSQFFQVIQPSSEHYKITNWSKDTIDAVPIDEGNGCRTTMLSLNFATKEFYQITRNGKNNCDHLPKLSKPRITQIVDGREIIKSEFKALKEKAYSYLSSDYRGRVDAQEKTEPKQLGK